MKLLKFIIFNLFFLNTSLLFCQSDIKTPSNDFDINNPELQKEFEKLASELDKNMTPDQKKELEEIFKLPPEELKKLFEETEKIVESMSEEEKKSVLEEAFGKDSPLLKDLFEEPIEQKPFEEMPVVKEEEKVTEKPKEEKKVIYTSKSESAKKIINNILNRISSFLIKIGSLPRVSCDSKVEKTWVVLHIQIRELESLLKVLSNKTNLLNIITSDEFTKLYKNLENLNEKLDAQEPKFVVPDTAGLKITFDEDELDNEEFCDALEIVKEIIDLLQDAIENKAVNKETKGLFEKYAPKELKEVQKQIGEIQVVRPNQNVPPMSPPFNPSSRSNGFRPSNFSSNIPFESGPFVSPSGPAIPGNLKTDSEKKADEKSKEDKKGEKEKKDKTDKGKKPSFDKPKTPTSKNIDEKIKELGKNFENITKNMTPSSEKDKDVKKKSNLNTSNLSVLIHYEDAIKSARSINSDIQKLSKDAQENYRKTVRQLYNEPSFGFEKIHKMLQDSSTAESNELIKDLTKQTLQKHEALKNLVEGKEEKEDLKDLKSIDLKSIKETKANVPSIG